MQNFPWHRGREVKMLLFLPPPLPKKMERKEKTFCIFFQFKTCPEENQVLNILEGKKKKKIAQYCRASRKRPFFSQKRKRRGGEGREKKVRISFLLERKEKKVCLIRTLLLFPWKWKEKGRGREWKWERPKLSFFFGWCENGWEGRQAGEVGEGRAHVG